MPARRTAVFFLALVVCVSLAACGGDDDGGAAGDEPATTAASDETTTGEDSGGEGTTVQLAADPDGGLAFDTETLEASAGKITIDFTNEASIPHNVSVEGETSETITGGDTTLELDLEPGEYEYICAVPGHAEAGMRGTLTVE